MDSVSNWAWWTIAGGILLSPVFAFLLAIVVEILFGVLTQAGAPALLLAAAAIILGWLLLRKRWTRRRAGNLRSDQA
jgi:hypothetical protein